MKNKLNMKKKEMFNKIIYSGVKEDFLDVVQKKAWVISEIVQEGIVEDKNKI